MDDLIKCQEESKKVWCLNVRFITSGKTINFSEWDAEYVCYTHDTIEQVEEKIEKKIGIPVKNQSLQYKGKDLSNEHTLFSYGIISKKHITYTLDLTLTKADGDITMFIKSLIGNNKCANWYVNPSETTIESIRKQICHCSELWLEKRTMMFGIMLYDGLLLDNNELTFADYGIINDQSTITIFGQIPASPLLLKNESGGCDIPETEFRAITVRQLKDVVVEIYKRCESEGWTSSNPNRKGELLRPEDVTLYDLNENFIKPITKQRKCSYVEMVANDGPQKPEWFVSHWWGEPVVQFVACIEQHAFDRNLSDDTCYWVCGYAINQHKAGDEVGNNPRESSFYKAMNLSKGTVTILDPDCTSYTRIWCSYEIYLSVVELNGNNESSKEENENDEQKLYDVYTIAASEELSNRMMPVGLTDGFVVSDKYKLNDFDGTLNLDKPKDKPWWTLSQSGRQDLFPLDTVRKALSIKLETAQATMPKDRIQILNAIIGSDNNNLNEEPPSQHEKYDEVNRILRAKFAISGYLSGYRHALEEADGRQQQDMMSEYRTVISKAPLHRLVMSFGSCKEFSKETKNFLRSLPSTLVHLDLDFMFVQFQSSNDATFGFDRLVNLKTLKLSYMLCKNIATIDGLYELLVNPKCNLIKVDLNFSGCKEISEESIIMFFESMQNQTNLQQLYLDFSDNKNISNLDGLGTSMTVLMMSSHLTKLMLIFRNCKKLNDDSVIKLMKTLVESPHTNNGSELSSPTLKLELNFSAGSCSFNLSKLLRPIKNTQDLKNVVQNL